MKQILTVLRFEFLNLVKNKIFMAITIGMVIVMGVVLSFPRIMNVFDKGEEKESQSTSTETKETIALTGNISGDANSLKAFLESQIPGVTIKIDNGNDVNKKVQSNEYVSAISLKDNGNYDYIVNTRKMTDHLYGNVYEAMNNKYKVDQMTELGVKDSNATKILSSSVVANTIELGKSQTKSFFYTYIVIFLLYMCIIIYGQQIAVSVASEKSSRAMEILITSAKPTNLIFGKVLGAGIAGLLQVLVIICSGAIFYNLNASFWGGNEIIKSIFDIPVSTIIYSGVFFILGYFVYAFIFGALGSLASRTEDVNTSVMPVTLIFIVAFFIVINGITTGGLDNPVMVVASYIPFTSPMAMFARVSMGDISSVEVGISIAILVLSSIGIGYLSASIYKKGVLLGKTVKLSQIHKLKKM